MPERAQKRPHSPLFPKCVNVWLENKDNRVKVRAKVAKTEPTCDKPTKDMSKEELVTEIGRYYRAILSLLPQDVINQALIEEQERALQDWNRERIGG